jgi:hypothetical protein
MLKSYTEYSKATPWEKLNFVAKAKQNEKYIVRLETIIYAETIRKNVLQFNR